MNTRTLIFRQLFEKVSSTYTYIVACPTTRIAAIIDPVLEMVERDAKLIKELHLDLRLGLNTHVHADHVTGTGRLAKLFPDMCVGLSDAAGAKCDFTLGHNEPLKIGRVQMECRHTPGHTNGCATFVLPAEGLALTGDALLIRGCGRTDFQQGNAGTLYDSVWNNILSLPEDFLLFPGHNYEGLTVSSVAEEKQHNPRLTLPKDQFISLMKNLNLPYPNQIDRAVPANMKNGEGDV